MIERVAEAITKAFEDEGRVFDPGQAEVLVRAALVEMKDPDHDMTAALLPPGADRTELLRQWRMVIDAALAAPSDDTDAF